MPWEERLLDLFDDLEQQAEGLALAARDVEVAEQSRAEYAAVDLASRLHASIGARVLLGLTGVGQVDGRLLRVGEGWCLLGAAPQEWIVRSAAITSARGISDRGLGVDARPVTARLGLASALRSVADMRSPAVLHRLDGSLTRGVPGRVGADFVEIRVGEEAGSAGYVELVPFAALSALRTA